MERNLDPGPQPPLSQDQLVSHMLCDLGKRSPATAGPSQLMLQGAEISRPHQTLPTSQMHEQNR